MLFRVNLKCLFVPSTRDNRRHAGAECLTVDKTRYCVTNQVLHWSGQDSNCNLQVVILSLWGIRSVIPLANICLGVIPNLICWQWDGLRASICRYLDSSLPGRSGLFTPPEVWLSRPEVAEVKDMQEKRGQGRQGGGGGGVEWRLFKNAAQVFKWCREGLLWDDRVSGRSGGKAKPECGDGMVASMLREDASDGWWLLDAVIVFR